MFVFFFETMRIVFLGEFSVCYHPKILLPWQREWRLLISIWSYSGATLALQLIQTAYRVSILTLISCTEKEESMGPMPYFGAITDNFSQIVIHLSHYIRHFHALSLSVTFRKHGSQYPTEIPAIQPLTEQGIQKYSCHRK